MGDRAALAVARGVKVGLMNQVPPGRDPEPAWGFDRFGPRREASQNAQSGLPITNDRPQSQGLTCECRAD